MSALEIARLLIGAASLIGGATISACNAYILLRYLRGGHGASFVPVVGGILGAIGFLILPVPSFRSAWWVPLFLDWGNVLAIAHAVIRTLGSKRR
jgi:hypothetical protein